MLAALAAYGVVLLRALWPRLGPLRAPVALYAAALLVMAWQAAERWRVLVTTPALLAAVGAGLFVASDPVLAWERFRRRSAYGQAVVLGTYFAAQWLIAASVSGDCARSMKNADAAIGMAPAASASTEAGATFRRRS